MLKTSLLIAIVTSGPTYEAYCPATEFQNQREEAREPEPIDLEIARVHSCAKRFLTSPCLRIIVKLDSGHRRLICGPKLLRKDVDK